MRTLILLLLITINSYSQPFVDTVFVHPDSLKDDHISLNKVWKYSPGDNLSWAAKSYNDSSWDTLNTNLRWGEYDISKWNGIGWFRKILKIDTTLQNKSVGLSLRHWGSSEIYLNGELVHSYGTVHVNPDSEKIYRPNNIPITLNFTSDSTYLLAIRYSNHQSVSDPEWTDSWFDDHGFSARIDNLNESIVDRIIDGQSNFGVNFAIFGIFISLAILYFLLHIFYSKQRENLYYALFSFSLSLLFFASMATKLVFTSLTWLIIFRVTGIVGIALTFLGYLGFIYSIFYKKMPKLIWFFIIGTVILGVMLFFQPVRDLANYALPVFIFIATLEGFRAIIVAIKNKKEHSWVIGTGVLVFVVFILAIFAINLFDLNPPGMYVLIVFLIGLFSLPASMSVYLARSIKSTNEKLGKQLDQIKELSAKELEAQQRNSELQIDAEREKAAKNEAVLQAKAAELQAKASEAERRILEAENERKTHELEEARELQLSLLPKTLPSLPSLDISVYMETATEVGGDYYDFYEDSNGELTVLIGDATGHGLNAGTMVTATKSLFNSHASNPNILETFEEISSSLRNMNFRFLSMCVMYRFSNSNCSDNLFA